MAGFQFSPAGVIPIPVETHFDAMALHGASASVAEPTPYDPEAIPDEPAQRAPLPQRPQSTVVLRPGAPAPTPAPIPAAISPRTVLKAARSRVKEIRAELRRMRALQKELGQLERMLAATKKPLASLTPINSRRTG